MTSACDDLSRLKKTALLPFLGAVALALILGFTLDQGFSFLVAVGTFIALWVVFHGVQDLRSKTENSDHFFAGLKRLSLSYWGMQLGHLGVAVCVIGVLFSVDLSDTRDVRFEPGDTYELRGYLFELDRYQTVQGPNYRAEEAVVTVSRKNQFLTDIFPQKRLYTVRGQTMTEAGIEGNLWRDLYVSMGEPLDGGAWSVRVYVKPFVRWIWYGAMLMAFGGLLAILDRRYRLSKPSIPSETAATGAA